MIGGFVWKLNVVEEVCTMVSGVGSKRFRGEKPADRKFIMTFFEGGLLQYYRSPIRDPSCIDAQA
jgi:hypothetical protein